MKHRISHIANMFARRAQNITNAWASYYWHHNPFGTSPKANEETYHGLWEAERANDYPEIDAFEKQTGFAVDKKWLDDLALHTQIVIKDSPLCYQHGRVLYSTLRQFLEQSNDNSAINIIETGTARGFSSVVMAKALQDAEQSGKIITFDVLPHRVPMLWNCIDDKDGSKTRAELLSPWQNLVDPYVLFVEGCSRINLPKVQAGRVHFAYLDGAHGYKDVMAEFGQVVPLQRAGDVIVFDDYSENVFPGLVQAVDEGCERWGYDQDVLRSNQQRAYVIATKR